MDDNMTMKNCRKNISAEPGDVVLDVTQNTLTKANADSNFSNNLELTVKQQDFINETNTPHSHKLTIPMSEVVRLAYLLKNYYSKTEADNKYGVTVTKQTTADSGFAATYVVKQNNTQVGTKINIPKDFLVRSATLKTVSTQNQPVNGYKVGDKYIDFVINTSDNSANDQHVYVNVKDLVDVYTADESTLTVSNNKFSVKSGGISDTHLTTALKNLINSKVDTAGTGLSKTGTTLKVNLSSAINSNSETNAATSKAVSEAIKEAKKYVDQEILGVLDPNGVVRLEIAEKADADHKHGNITKDGELTQSNTPVPNAIATTNASGKIVASTTIKKEKISDFAHNQASSTITDTTNYPNIENTQQTQSSINSAVNIKLGKKVDKETGKGLSTNDFTTDLKNKLDRIEREANKYVHPTQGALTGKPTSAQAPGFGSTFTVSQVSVNTLGHVTGLTDRTITIPGTEASTSGKGLMSKTMYEKLDKIEPEANKYVHPTPGALTGKPTSAQTPGFGSTFTVSQVSVNALGHVTGLTDRNITIPATKGNGNAFGIVKLTDSYTTTAATASANIGASGAAVANAYNTLNSSITNVRNDLTTLNNKYYKSNDLYVRLIRTQPSGVMYPKIDINEWEGSRLQANVGDRLNVKVMSRSGQSVAGRRVRLRFGTTVKTGITNNAGMLPLNNGDLGLNTGVDGVAYAIMQGDDNHEKSFDIQFIEF